MVFIPTKRPTHAEGNPESDAWVTKFISSMQKHLEPVPVVPSSWGTMSNSYKWLYLAQGPSPAVCLCECHIPEPPWSCDFQHKTAVDVTHDNWDLHFTIIGHESVAISGPLPLSSRESTKCPHSTKQVSCANMWVQSGQHVHPMRKTVKLISLLFDGTCTVCGSVLLISTTANCSLIIHHAVVLYPTMHSLTWTGKVLSL